MVKHSRGTQILQLLENRNTHHEKNLLFCTPSKHIKFPSSSTTWIRVYPPSLIFNEVTMEYEYMPQTTIFGFGSQITGAINATDQECNGLMIAPFVKIYFVKNPTEKYMRGILNRLF